MNIGKQKAQNFRRALQRRLREPVRLIVHDNTHIFLTAHFRKKIWTIRLHWMFLRRPAMAREIARYLLKRDKSSSQAIDRYIEDHWHWVRHPLPPIRTRGRVYDLQKIFDSLNRRFWRGRSHGRRRINAKITWGSDSKRAIYEQLQMGSFSSSRRLITVHPRLDHKKVPRYVVEATIFHEMCHAALPVRRVGGRRQIHPPAFKRLEARYPFLKKAIRWEERHLGKILMQRRRRQWRRRPSRRHRHS